MLNVLSDVNALKISSRCFSCFWVNFLWYKIVFCGVQFEEADLQYLYVWISVLK